MVVQLKGISTGRAVNPFNFSITRRHFKTSESRFVLPYFPCHSYFSYVETVVYSVKLGLQCPETPWAMLTIRNHINTFNNGMAAKYEHSMVNEPSAGLGTGGAGLYC